MIGEEMNDLDSAGKRYSYLLRLMILILFIPASPHEEFPGIAPISKNGVLYFPNRIVGALSTLSSLDHKFL